MEMDIFTQRFVEKYELANKWIRLQNKKISILQSLKNKGISKIIIYGASEFALRLLEQCENENVVEVIGIADKNITSKGEYYKDIPLLSVDDLIESDMRNVCVVITAMGYYNEISNELKEKGITNITSLREMIYDVYC